jgi:hypothetical protein
VGLSVDGTEIKSSYFSGGTVRAGFSTSDLQTVSATEAYAGGIAGVAGGTITLSYARVSENSGPQITDAASIDARASETSAAGGITGKNTNIISQSYAIGAIKARASASGKTYAGGVSGMSTSTIENVFALAQVDARMLNTTAIQGAMAGGIVGYSDGSASVVKTSYAAGSVSAFNILVAAVAAGGIVGQVQHGTVSQCVALQQYVASNGNLHERVGSVGGNTSLSNNFAYESMLSENGGLAFANNNPPASVEGTNISASEAKSLSKYTSSPLSWNGDDVWQTINNSFPTLKNISSPLIYLPAWADIW